MACETRGRWYVAPALLLIGLAAFVGGCGSGKATAPGISNGVDAHVVTDSTMLQAGPAYSGLFFSADSGVFSLASGRVAYYVNYLTGTPSGLPELHRALSSTAGVFIGGAIAGSGEAQVLLTDGKTLLYRATGESAVLTLASEHYPGLHSNQSGTVALAVPISFGALQTFGLVEVAPGDSAKLLLRSGDTLPGIEGSLSFSRGSVCGIAEDGTVFFRGQRAGGVHGIYAVAPGGQGRIVTEEGETVSGGIEIATLQNCSASRAGAVAFIASYHQGSDQSEGIFLTEASGTTRLLFQNQGAAPDGGVLGTFQFLSLRPIGPEEIAFVARVAPTLYAPAHPMLLLAQPDASGYVLHTLARYGGPVPESPAAGTIYDFGPPDINENGTVGVPLITVSSGIHSSPTTQTTMAAFYHSDGTSLRLIGEGDVFSGDTLQTLYTSVGTRTCGVDPATGRDQYAFAYQLKNGTGGIAAMTAPAAWPLSRKNPAASPERTERIPAISKIQ